MDRIVPPNVTKPINREEKKGICTFLRPYDKPTTRLSRFDETANNITDSRCKITPSLLEVGEIRVPPLTNISKNMALCDCI